MEFTGRSRELGALRAALDRPTPVVARVSGLPGVGKSELVRQAVAEDRSFVFRCPPLPEAGQKKAFAESWLSRPDDFDEGFIVTGVQEWADLLAGVAEAAATPGPPWVLVIDDADRLTQSRARIGRALAETMTRLARPGSALHVVLVSRDADALTFPSLDDFESVDLSVPPLTLRSVAPWLPGKRPQDRLRAYGVFGGTPRVLRALDRSVTVGNNVRRLLLEDGGPLAELPLLWLERVVQTPARYASILRALRTGEREWSAIHAEMPDLTRSGQVAPYLTRLESLGFLERRRSLDAAPRSRSTRYRIVDPLIASWFRFVLPWRLSSRSVPVGAHYAEHVRPELHGWMEGILPALARQHLAHSAIETLGASARECGSLWDAETEIPVAGTLANGAAFYGVTRWSTPGRGDAPLDDLDTRIRATRYGFGREGRYRVLVSGQPVSAALRREFARRHDAHLIDAETLLGER